MKDDIKGVTIGEYMQLTQMARKEERERAARMIEDISCSRSFVPNHELIDLANVIRYARPENLKTEE